jgi:hypothetical protein
MKVSLLIAYFTVLTVSGQYTDDAGVIHHNLRRRQKVTYPVNNCVINPYLAAAPQSNSGSILQTPGAPPDVPLPNVGAGAAPQNVNITVIQNVINTGYQDNRPDQHCNTCRQPLLSACR